MPEDPHLRTKAIVFDTFAFLGVFVNVAALASAIFLPHIKRKRIWFSLITSWALYSASYLLLLGRQREPDPPRVPRPPIGLCIFQAALTTSMDVVCIVASTCFTVDLALRIDYKDDKDGEDGKEPIDHRLANFLAFFPWMIFVTMFLLAQLIVQDSSMVIPGPSRLFCSIESQALLSTTWIMVLFSAVILFPTEAYIAYLFYDHSVLLRKNSDATPTKISISTFIRLVLFTLISATGIGVHCYIISRPGNTVTACSLILTCLPVLGGLLFGTTRDILKAWMFWKKTPAADDDHQYFRFDPDPRNEYEDSSSLIRKS